MAIIDNLLAYYPLDEASGNAIDAHGSNDLTETGGTIAASTGPGGVGGSRDCEAGDTESFDIADNTDFSMGDISFTITCWVNLESVGANRPVVAKWNNGTPQREYWLMYRNSTARFSFFISNDGTGTNEAAATAFGAPSLATWYFLVAYHDATGNVIGISVNAGAAATTAHTTGVFDGTAPFQIGRNEQGGGEYHDGLLAQVGVWKNRVLSADEITWLYNSGNGRTYAAIVAGDAAGVVARRCVARQAVNRASTY